MHNCIRAILSVLFIAPLFANGQRGSEISIERDSRVINPVPPAPEMASLGKFGDIPFEKSTGTASMSIPIYTINYDGVTIPIQLQYSSSGFRPSDVGSYLGLHWMMTGIGGISRSIKGLPDEDGYLTNTVDEDYVDSVHALSGSLDGQSALTDMNVGTDISQDAYSLSANNLSGKFFLNANKDFTFSVKNDLKLYHQVTAGGGGSYILKFWLKDTRGNRYQFDSTERTYIVSQNGYSRSAVSQDGITSWKLTKIITAGGKEIVFNYSSYVFSYTTVSHDVYMSESTGAIPPDEFIHCGCSDVDTWKYGTNLYSYHTKLLTSIVTGNETVEFTYADDNSAANYKKKLTDIVVKDKDGITRKKIQFVYGYYSGDARLKLTQFRAKDVLSPAVDSAVHSFTYFEDYSIPAPNSRSMDGFKYFNGASNSHLIVSTHTRFTGNGSADRVIRPEYAKQTLLDKVTYPTGGSTNFVYESNGDVAVNDLGPGLRIKQLINKDAAGNITNDKEFIYRDFEGPPLLIDNEPYETYAEFAGSFENGCDRLVLTSDNQFSTIANTIPLSEDFYYKEVDVIENGDTDIKTTCKYTVMETMDGDLQVRPEVELYYKNVSGIYSAIKKTEFEYENKGLADDPNFVLQFAVLPADLRTFWAYTPTFAEWCVTLFMGTAKSLPRFQAEIRIKEKIDKEYNGSDSLQVVTKYTYGSNHEMPLSIKSTDSKGDTLEHKIYYPSEGSLLASPSLSSGQLIILDTMVNRNMLEFVVAEEVKRDGGLIDGTRTQYGIYNSSYYLPDEISDRKTSGSYTTRINYLDYDASGNLLSVQKENDAINTFIWDYNKLYPIASATNAAVADVAATSFESDGKGGWTFSGATNVTYSVTGNKSYQTSGGNITRSGLTSATYIVSYWGKSGSVNVNSAGPTRTGKTIGDWTYYEHQVTTTSITVSGSNYVDELRLYPQGALMTTYTFTPLVGMTSQCDVNNQITYYTYDGLGRLIEVRDEEKNILKKICYNFAGQPENCNLNLNPIWQPVGQPRCKPCPANNNYISNIQEHQEKDINPYSPTYNTFRWVEDGVSSNCLALAGWEAINSTCELDGQGQTTGYELITEKDMNPCSPSYNQTRQVALYNLGACPLPNSCDCSSFGEGWGCVNNECELGVQVVTESRNEAGTWFCTYHYEFSDGSWSGDYSAVSGSPCAF